MFLDDHVLLVVLNGSLLIRHGKQEFTIGKHQMVLLKKHTVIDYKTGTKPENSKGQEYIRFIYTADVLNAFMKIAHLHFAEINEAAHVVRGRITERLQKYLSSLKPYFNEADDIEDSLVRVKLLELLFELTQANRPILRQLLQVQAPLHPDINYPAEDSLINIDSLK